jgi:diguanylate cyclase (GGDEF)-like protein/PAS domain S-box-containing protein
MTSLKHENRRLSEQNAALQEQVNLLTGAFENVRHGLCVFDAKGRIAFCNHRYADAIGLPWDKVLPGTPATDLIRMASEAGYYSPDRSIEDIEKEFWRNLDCEADSPRQIDRGGRTYIVHPGQTPQGNLVATFEDVTLQLQAQETLKKSEKRLSGILDALPDCIKIFDARGQLLYINPVGLETLESTSLEALVASGHIAVPPEYLAECIAVHQRVLQGERVVWTYEIISTRGRRVHVESHAVPFILPDGSAGQMCITRDISKRKRAEDALRDSEERLRLVQDAMGVADFENDCTETTVCSDRFFDQVGLPIGDNTISVWDWLDLVHDEDRDRLQAEMEQALLEGDTFDSEYRIIRRDNGEIRWISCRSMMLRDEHGKPIRTIGSHRDITHRKQSELALQENEKRLGLVHEATGLAEFWADGNGLAHVSDRLIEQLGMPRDTRTLSFEGLLEYVHPDDREPLRNQVEVGLKGQRHFEAEFRILHGQTGEERWIHSRSTMDHDEAGRPVYSIGAHLDITDRKQAEDALRESEERFRLAAEAAGFGVWDYDPVTDTREWSNRLREIFGLTSAVEPSLKLAADCIHPDDRARFLKLLHAVQLDKSSVKMEDTFRVTRANDAAEQWVTLNCWKTRRYKSNVFRIILTLRDITEERSAAETIRWSASHDALTSLANRAQFQEVLQTTIQRSTRSGRRVGLLMIDIDHLKQINDTLGHDAGDLLLKLFAERLKSAVRPADVVARLGGDEFAIIVPNMKKSENLAKLSDSIHDRLRDPFVYNGRIVDCCASIGAAIFPQDGASPTELMKNADMALYSAKNAGRSTTKIYQPTMRIEIERRTNMVQLAREALRDDRILPYYQPKLDLRTRRVVGFEALLRWRAPGGQVHLPEKLEAAFEDLDVACALSDRMIEQAIVDMRSWIDRDVDFGHVAMNASAADFRRENFAERVLEKLDRANIPTSMFQLEVTETVFLGRGAEYVHNALAMFNSAGVRISLDDFGTGYASLRHLKQFPVAIIKIDRSFVRDMQNNAGDDAIVRAVINLGRSLAIEVVAEGIEEETHVQKLLRYGCVQGQGFLFSEARPAMEVPAMLARKLPIQKLTNGPLKLAANF